jgi:4-amino-4-deoxy-L-arabinose transferase
MKNPVLFLGLAFFILLIGLGSWGLTESSEARYAEIGHEVYTSGDYLHPTQLGIRHYHKPPMTYYITSLGYSIFGANEFGARFFLSVAFILQLVLIWKISLLLFNDRQKALAAALIYFGIPLALLSVRILTTDAYLNTFALAAVYFFIHHRTYQKTWSVYAFYLVWGLGFLTKGPAVLIPVGAFIFFWKWMHWERIYISIHSILAGILCLMLSTSWYLLVTLDNPAFLEYFIGEQILGRAVSAGSLNRAKPFWYYLAFAPLVALPWLPFVGWALFRFRKNLKKQQPLILVVSLTALAILLFYSVVSSKLIFYVLPMFPFVALLAGYYLPEVTDKTRSVLSRILLGLTLLIGLGMGFVNLAPNFYMPLGYGIVFGLLSVGALLFLIRNFREVDLNRTLGLSVLFGIQVIWGYALVGRFNPNPVRTFKELAQVVQKMDSTSQRPVVVYNFWGPSIAFYLENKLITVKEGTKRIDPEVQFEANNAYRQYHIDTDLPGESDRLLQLIQEKNPILIFLTHDAIPNPISQKLSGKKTQELYNKYIIYY